MKITRTVALPVVCAGLLVASSVRPAESQLYRTRFLGHKFVLRSVA